ncbi:hypothetical protein [Leptolyngbya sp. FACHB-541]|uniref:hypothetical protein n=1 Tax=Leptolyngbya sp. FACHB-541 TaxID=2692810 RepID=UPI0018F01F91|nr:hypothetical protein [Leptolyngbya sp. FACHB-541]
MKFFYTLCNFYWNSLDRLLGDRKTSTKLLAKILITIAVCVWTPTALLASIVRSQTEPSATTAAETPVSEATTVPEPVQSPSEVAQAESVPDPQETVETETAPNPFNFPRSTCGDSSSGSDDTWYPVFVDSGNLESIRNSYCADAVATKREDTGVETVQLASFTDRSRAEEFASAVKGEIGQPSLPEEPETPSASQTPSEAVSSVEQSCDPSYPGICISPNEGDLNCGDIPYRRFQVLPPDPHGFDREGDGIGCES